MKIKSARYFRDKYLTDIRHQAKTGYDTSFVGCSHQLPDGTYVKGFFDLYHGDKPDVGHFLSNFLKIAEDGQAIYEFLQNAADSNSTLFYMFYNEKYFLAVNNGEAFNQKGLRSLLNVAQSTKSDSTQIGRFGIGFKLVHRLVGKGDGMQELTQDYKGPILFSWKQKQDLISLMNHSSIECVDDISDDSALPYLLKLILTNFPAEPFETVRDLNFEEKVLFNDDEYKELCTLAKDCLQAYIDSEDFNQGSLFFIRLGEGKKELLDKNYEQNLKAGVEYSLNTLKNLNDVRINGERIEKVPLKMESGIIEKESDIFKEIDPQYKDDDIHFSIGYNEINFSEETPFEKVEALKKSPTFYKYFPLCDEIHHSAVFIHCDSISNETNRRKMIEDSINKKLIPEIAHFIVKTLSKDRDQRNVDEFYQLYANLLLSDTPHDNSDWLKKVYYDIIQDYLVTSIPTLNGFADCADNVKIKDISTNVPLSVVNDEYQWFKWNSTNLEALLAAAKTKLGIKTYDIVDLIIDADVNRLNDWIASIDEITYKNFLDEVNSTKRSICNNTKFTRKLKNIKLFKFNDGTYYSYAEIIKIEDGQPTFRRGKTVYTSYKTVDINSVLTTLGFVVSNINIDEYPKIKGCFDLPSDKMFFDSLADSLETCELTTDQKKILLRQLTTQDETKKFKNVGDTNIKRLCICRNNAGELVPLKSLLGCKYTVPSWLNDFQIRNEDYFDDIDRFLMKEEDIFNEIIYKNWCQIIPDTKDASSINAFYSDVKRLYDINPEKNKNLKGRKYVFTEGNEFASPDSIVYNTKMSDNAIDYKSLGNAIRVIFKKEIPNKSTATILEEDPFGLPNDNICDLEPCGTEGVALEDIKNLLRFCVSNNETFFKMFVIRSKDNAYHIGNRREEDYSQVYPGDSRTESFIKAYCDDTMITLPKSLVEYKNSDGILSGENLHSAILHSIDDIDAHKDELIDVLRYDARKEFILELSKIRVDLNEGTTTDSYSFKILDLASRVLKENDNIEDFRHKLVIEKDGQSFTHDQIPQSIADSFKISGAKKKFDMAQILPDENQNGALLIELVNKYSKIGIQKNKLNSLLGITDEVDIENLYDTLITNYHTLQNSQQLAFVLVYCSNENIELPEYNLFAADEEEYNGKYVVQKYDFISENYTLSKRYRDLKEYIDLPYRGDLYINSPYINEDGEFVCPGLNTKENDEADYIKVISLLNYLKKLYKSGQGKFKDVDWSSINEELGFNANESVYPAKYATEDEQLPESVENWAEESLDNKELLCAMGVHTDEDIVIGFRMFLTDVLSQFDPHSLYSSNDEAALERSLEWLSYKPIFPLTQEKYDALEVAIERINELRSYSDIEIEEQYDFDELYNKSIEYSDQGYKKWEENTGLHIYLYDGPLPSIIKINKYIDSVVFKYKDGNITDDGEHTIYVNSKVDIQTAMFNLADSNENGIGLTKENVYELFSSSIVELKDRLHQLEEENKRLKAGLPSSPEEARMRSEESYGIDTIDRPELNELARKRVKIKLEEEGYKFKCGIGSSSIIPGVIAPNGSIVPLIVKSCKIGRLFINPNEWEKLLKPNAMLWIFDGNDVMPLHLRALIRNQDELVLRMDTRNLDDISRISEFARILKYFKQVHFDFNSVRPTTIAASYKEYAFDDRPMDEKPEEDDFE